MTRVIFFNLLLVISLIDSPVLSSTPQIVSSVALNTTCSSSSQIEMSMSSLRNETRMILQSLFPSDEWTEIVNFDMANSSHNCPSPWTTVTWPSRLCTASSCNDSLVINVPTTYSQIRGQIIGSVIGLCDAFTQFFNSNPSIEEGYLDGVSITHGHPRQHVWSFGAGHAGRCPCDNSDASIARHPPSFVGDDYFCDGLYNGLLWDGQNCTSACCTFNSPPWFNVTLPTSTSNDIEVRICIDEPLEMENEYIKKMILQIK